MGDGEHVCVSSEGTLDGGRIGKMVKTLSKMYIYCINKTHSRVHCVCIVYVLYPSINFHFEIYRNCHNKKRNNKINFVVESFKSISMQ